ncbi:MAG: hypothetical protein IIY11_03745, partial [Clostridia bacterium]|nr:hypothetical protein [Clostridia bacterium]
VTFGDSFPTQGEAVSCLPCLKGAIAALSVSCADSSPRGRAKSPLLKEGGAVRRRVFGQQSYGNAKITVRTALPNLSQLR